MRDGSMSEKKYLVTEREIRDIVDCAASSGTCHESIDDLPSEEWLEAHQYHKPTCHDDGERVFRCTRCGAFVLPDSVMCTYMPIPIKYCPNCGAKVIDYDD